MSTLSTELRNKLERVIIDARDVAEAGAKAALEVVRDYANFVGAHGARKEIVLADLKDDLDCELDALKDPDGLGG